MAKNSGRRSDADRAATTLAIVLAPTRRLSAAEKRTWTRVVDAWPPEHFIASDAELLTQYCAACVVFEAARKREDLAAMDKSGRLALSYATKLRITPQSRYDAQAAARQANRGKQNLPASDGLIGGDYEGHATH